MIPCIKLLCFPLNLLAACFFLFFFCIYFLLIFCYIFIVFFKFCYVIFLNGVKRMVQTLYYIWLLQYG